MKKEVKLSLLIISLLFLSMGNIFFRSIYQKESKNIKETENWLVEHQIPCEVVESLSSHFLIGMKQNMESSEYEVNDLIDQSSWAKKRLLQNICYTGDVESIDSYYIYNRKKNSYLWQKEYIRCEWDIDELALESFACICYTKIGNLMYKISEIERPVHVGMGCYEVEVPLLANMTGEMYVILLSKFVPARGLVAEADSIQCSVLHP